MSCLLDYALIMSSFLSWLSSVKSSLSKISIAFLFSLVLFCILLFLSGLNKLSEKYIWKILQVTLSRSWIRSSTTQNLQNHEVQAYLQKTEQIKEEKKSLAVSPKLLSSFLLKFLWKFYIYNRYFIICIYQLFGPKKYFFNQLLIL